MLKITARGKTIIHDFELCFYTTKTHTYTHTLCLHERLVTIDNDPAINQSDATKNASVASMSDVCVVAILFHNRRQQ